VDLPTHASVNRLSTGTCVDYSFALTTMLRKAGYSKDDVLSVNGEGHGYNLLRFPGEPKWHYVDTVGNNGGGVYGGTGYADPETAWYKYCRKLDDGRSSAAETAPFLIIEMEPTPMWQLVPTVAISQTCTELNPCTEAYTMTVEPPGPVVDLDAYKVASSGEITPGEKVLISITLQNHETTSVDALVRETFIPGMAYDLTAQEQSFESFTFEYHTWNVTIPPQSTHTLTFTAAPKGLGYYTFAPTVAFVNGNAYETSSPIVKVVCDPDGTCGAGESYRFCPQDCTSGIQDDYCDMLWDLRIDPDCAYGMDPDHNPGADTDGDGVVDGSDDCPLTPAGETVDANGCACSQKICDDGDPATQDGCNAATAACEYIADTDQDGEPDAGDNCPNDYNPQQHDTDGDGTGDQCEIGPITADTTLDGGTYRIFDYELGGAVVISASNVTLDCNGATISGDGTGYGIYVPGNVYSVTIQNCQISAYRYGIYVDGSGGNQLLDNTLQQNSFGIVLGSASGNTVSGNAASSNDQGGVYLEGSTGNQVSDNTIDSNGSLGLFIHTSSDNDITNNSVCGNTNGDFSVYESTNAGDGNTCNQPGDWSDAGVTGCSHACGMQDVFLPVVLRNYQ
jgi:parallel beta-helix repeat protein